MGEPAASGESFDEATKAKGRYDACVRHLQFELELFWKRSLFFWAFIAAAFAGFAEADKHPVLQVAIASFGLVCCVVWTLANRGSKYWYESWERKLKNAEKSVTGPLFSMPEPEKVRVTGRRWVREWWSVGEEGRWWFKGKRYSPSRLAIALSDYVVFLWLCILVSRIPLILLWPPSRIWLGCRNVLVLSFVVLSLVYALLLRWLCHSEDPVIGKPTGESER